MVRRWEAGDFALADGIPHHEEHALQVEAARRRLRKLGAGVSAGHRCTSSTPSCRHLAQVATTEPTPFSRMLASVIGSMILPSRSRARRETSTADQRRS